MDTLPEHQLLKRPPGTVDEIRKIYNLDKPDRLEEAIKILSEWIQKQDHIIKKDFSKEYLEKSLIFCKGSVEKTKKQIDRLCTMKTLMPKYFTRTNVKLELQSILDMGKVFPLPILTNDFCRIIMVQVDNKELTKEVFTQHFQYLIVFAEYLKAHDYVDGYILIYDCRQMNLFDVLTKMDTVELQQIAAILIEGYGARVKSVHMITESKATEMLINLIKQFVSEKIGKRIHVQRNLEDLHKAVPKELLPVDYGGKQRSVDSMNAETVQELSSAKHVEYMKMKSKACSDVTKRHAAKFNEEYMGMPGSFRCLSVD